MSLLTKAGITKLSELIIDADKDWQAKEISNLKGIVAAMAAGDLPYRGASVVESLAKSTQGYYLKQGADYPEWDVGPSAPEESYESVELIPDDAILPAANPPGEAKIDGANFSYKVLDFDMDTEEKCYWEFVCSLFYMGQKVTVDVFWLSTGAGDCLLGISTLGRKNGETWDSALGTEHTEKVTNDGATALNRTRIEFYPGWESGDKVVVKLARKAADGDDTLNADARVLGIAVHFTGEFTPGEAFGIDPSMPVDVTPASSGAWVDVDCKPYIPLGATGVALHVINADASNRLNLGLRKKGSTDDRHDDMYTNHHFWAMVGVNSERIFQTYLEDHTKQTLYLVAYTKAGVTFFTNAYDKTPGSGTWLTVNCSAECPGAIGLIFEYELLNQPMPRHIGWRKNGSADDRHSTSGGKIYIVVGCDASQLCQLYNNDVSGLNRYWLVGYITGGCIFKTNGDDISLGGIGAYTEIDLATEAPDSILAFIQVFNGYTTSRSYDLRKKGYTGEYYRDITYLCSAIVPLDEVQKIEGKIEKLDTYFFVLGYAVLA